MKRTLTALTVAATMFASSAYAFDPADLQKLMDTNECVKCDLSGANLEAANLMAAILSDANLSGTRLAGANLAYADLNGTNLAGADLESARLGRFDLRGAVLCNTTMPNGSVIYSGC